jgi:hypothetical protein
MHPGPLPDTLRLRDEIARHLLDEADDRPTPAVTRVDDRPADEGTDRSDAVDLLTDGGSSAERR